MRAFIHEYKIRSGMESNQLYMGKEEILDLDVCEKQWKEERGANTTYDRRMLSRHRKQRYQTSRLMQRNGERDTGKREESEELGRRGNGRAYKRCRETVVKMRGRKRRYT